IIVPSKKVVVFVFAYSAKETWVISRAEAGSGSCLVVVTALAAAVRTGKNVRHHPAEADDGNKKSMKCRSFHKCNVPIIAPQTPNRPQQKVYPKIQITITAITAPRSSAVRVILSIKLRNRNSAETGRLGSQNFNVPKKRLKPTGA